MMRGGVESLEIIGESDDASLSSVANKRTGDSRASVGMRSAPHENRRRTTDTTHTDTRFTRRPHTDQLRTWVLAAHSQHSFFEFLYKDQKYLLQLFFYRCQWQVDSMCAPNSCRFYHLNKSLPTLHRGPVYACTPGRFRPKKKEVHLRSA